MSACTHESMTNHHVSVGASSVVDTLGLWCRRHQERREMARWTERELHDLGLSWSEMIAEADKPFWRP